MFQEFLPDLLRGITTTICVLFLLPILSQSKIKTKTYLMISIIIVLLNLIACTFFYMTKNYTAVVYFILIGYIITIIGFGFLFKETLYQWIFNGITVLNTYVFVVILSYYLSALTPYSEYTVTLFRLILFVMAYFLFKKVLYPLYIQIYDNWGAFILPTLGILINYLYLMLSLGDVLLSMNQNIIYFVLLTLIALFTYISIYSSLINIRQKYLLREDNLKKEAVEGVLRSEISSYETAILLAKQTKHDFRHHNAILLEHLNREEYAAAKKYLNQYDEFLTTMQVSEFSKNTVINAVLRIYDRRAKEQNITFLVHSNSDSYFQESSSDIAIMISNLLENAMNATTSLSSKKVIQYDSHQSFGSLLIEIRNHVEGSIHFENGFPISTRMGGGIGLRSVESTVKKYRGMLDIKQIEDEFIVQIIFPIDALK